MDRVAQPHKLTGVLDSVSILRTLVERLSRGRVLQRRITVKHRSVPILVSPDAQLKYLHLGARGFDQDLIGIAEQYLNEHSNVWDIGANVGVFTFAAATVASKGTIVSIEADIWLANILRKTAAFQEYAHTSIRVVPTAISDANSVAVFLIAARGRASNTLATAGGRSQMGGVRETQYVPTLTLDTLLETFPQPDFVKIDVEGAEDAVLRGAKRLVDVIRPTFFIEVGENVSDEIFARFKAAAYLAFDPSGKQLEHQCAPDTLFIPQEKHTQLKCAQ